MKRIRHKLNVDGDFYVEDGICTACDAPHYHAPELMGYAEDFHCYFKKQPQTEEEVQHAIEAVQVSCCEGVQYGGNNPDILKRLQNPNFNKSINQSTNSNIAEKNLIQKLFERLLDIFR